jgi:hypothetical protein
LFAALEVATGRVTNRCAARHRHQEFLGFLKQLARTYPRRRLHLVCDNYATHKHPRSAPGSPATPASSYTHPDFGVLAQPGRGVLLDRGTSGAAPWQLRQRHRLIRRVTDLIAAISRFCAAWNECCQRFSWTKSADEILTKLNRQTTSATQH